MIKATIRVIIAANSKSEALPLLIANLLSPSIPKSAPKRPTQKYKIPY